MLRLRPVILTLWNEFEAIEGADIMANIAQNPVLICIRLRVTTDNCKLLYVINIFSSFIHTIFKIYHLVLPEHCSLGHSILFPDLSLSTQSSSVILVSPIVQEAGNLRAWSAVLFLFFFLPVRCSLFIFLFFFAITLLYQITVICLGFKLINQTSCKWSTRGVMLIHVYWSHQLLLAV